MHTNPEIVTELKEISPYLTGLSLTMPYSVPQGYFDNLALQIIQHIGADHTLPGIQPVAYKVPPGYFNGLADDILSKVRSGNSIVREVDEELKTVAPFLSGVPRQNVYTVPQGYFDTAPAVPESKPARLVKMPAARKWTQYAAAAVVAGILVTGAFLFTGDKKTGFKDNAGTDLSATLQTISDSDLDSYIMYAASGSEPGPELGTGISNMSDEELNHYLSENDEAEFIPASN